MRVSYSSTLYSSENQITIAWVIKHMGRVKLIGLENLPDNFRLFLDESFRQELFERTKEKTKTWKKLRETLGCSEDTLREQRKGHFSIKVKDIKKISLLTEIPLKKIESHITSLKTWGPSKILKVKLPICATKELASILGHFFGDGHVGQRHCDYFNTKKELIEEVKQNIKIVFGFNAKETPCKDGYEIYLPVIIGKLLFLMGAPKGNKIKMVINIPSWIKNGSKEIKISFIRALFDDDSCVDLRHRYIVFHQSKIRELEKQHKKYLETIRKILLELATFSNPVIEWMKGKETVRLGFTICTHKNLLNFSKRIRFKHQDKNSRLAEIIKSFRQIQYGKGEAKILIKQELEKRPQTIISLATKLNRSYDCIWSHLKDLYIKKEVKRTNSIPIVWKLNN